MTIDNHCGQDDQAPGSQAAAHSALALEQAALYATRLAIARWINQSSASMQSVMDPDPAPAMSRATWYANAQQNFQEWLARGGFAQYEIARAEHADHVSPLMTPTLYQVGMPHAGTGPKAIGACID